MALDPLPRSRTGEASQLKQFDRAPAPRAHLINSRRLGQDRSHSGEQFAPDEALKALALGAVGLLARQRQREVVSSRGRPHPIRDLTGQPVEVIVEAVFAAILAAHAPTEPDGSWSDAWCASCTALIDLASPYGDPTHMEWPDPVRRLMADILDAELAARRE